MLFNSFQFIVFLPLVIITYYSVPHRARWAVLLVASYCFYMAWKPAYIVLIIISTLVDYCAGILMDRQSDKKKRKPFLMMSLIVNLSLLFVFKYFNFFNQELGQFYHAVSGGEYPIAALRLILPMGISFYTFQTLSYSIDVYRGTRKAERHLGYFALYVTYFPQLVAGPIERSDRLLPQLKEKHTFHYENAVAAILRIAWGFFKKVIIADRAAVMVDTIFGNLHSYSGIYLFAGIIGFALQIYCDFSAYSDIAIGSAKLMGIDLMENFKVPYLSKSFHEFWSRWHISLSTWFRDYLYIPLGGNRMDKKWKVYCNLMIVFVVSGFWHGANWTFLFWGALHGLYLVSEKLISEVNQKLKRPVKIPPVFKTMITFLFVLFAWIFFRADNIHDAVYILRNLGIQDVIKSLKNPHANWLGMDIKDFWVLIAASVWLFAADVMRYQRNRQILIRRDFLQGLMAIFLIGMVIVFGYYGGFEPKAFIYFQF